MISSTLLSLLLIAFRRSSFWIAFLLSASFFSFSISASYFYLAFITSCCYLSIFSSNDILRLAISFFSFFVIVTLKSVSKFSGIVVYISLIHINVARPSSWMIFRMTSQEPMRRQPLLDDSNSCLSTDTILLIFGNTNKELPFPGNSYFYQITFCDPEYR